MYDSFTSHKFTASHPTRQAQAPSADHSARRRGFFCQKYAPFFLIAGSNPTSATPIICKIRHYMPCFVYDCDITHRQYYVFITLDLWYRAPPTKFGHHP